MALLAFDNVSFSYPGSSAPALRGVSLQLQAGEYLAVLGANGSGKSTLALHMNGLLRPSEGSVSLQLTKRSFACKLSSTWKKQKAIRRK